MKKPIKRKTGLAHKIAALIFISGLILMIMGFGLGYFLGFRLLRNTITDDYMEMARMLSQPIDRILNEEIADLHIYMSHPLRKDAVKEANLEYKGMNKDAIQKYFKDMDEKWESARESDPLIKNILDTATSQRLKILVDADTGIDEIFMTDRYGGLVASSGRTSDFFQADETWWQESFADGKGDDFIGDVEFDESVNKLSISLAVPVRDDSGQAIGVCKSVMHIGRLFAPLENFRIGKTGHAVLINKKGDIIFHKEIPPLSRKLIDEKDLKKILTVEEGWVVANAPYIYKDKVFIAFHTVNHPLLLRKNMRWRICIIQDAKEVLSALYRLMLQLFAISAVLLVVLMIVGYAFSRIFVNPITKLRYATEKVASGDLDYKAGIKTGDELEQFADSFNEMTAKLKHTTTSIDNLNKEIAERKEAEGKIKRAAAEWQRTFDSITDFIFILNKDSVITKVNKAFAAALKLKPEEIEGKKCYELLHKTNKHWPGCPFAETQKDGKAHMQEVEDPNIGIPLLVTTSPIYDEHGKLEAVVHLAKDISEIKKAEKALKDTKDELAMQAESLKKTNETIKVLYNELEKSNEELRKLDQLKSDFVSTVSHELRTPLSITKEGISLVLDKIPGTINEKQEKILNTSRDNIDRLARIINDLLDISKIEAGRLELKKVSLDMNDVVSELVTFFREKAKKKGIELRLDIPKEGMELYADPDKLKQVFINLISNSLKFTEKGYIEISAKKLKDNLECSVLDTGKGILPEDMPKIFNKFAQFGRVAGPGEKGTGLGLSIVKGIIELHNGSIDVESKPGEMTKFTFKLPLYSSDELFKEYVESGIEEAKKRDYKLSLFVISIKGFDKLKAELQPGKIKEVLTCLETTLKNALRRKGDMVVKDTGEVLVLLTNCNKDDALRVEGRLEQALGECTIQHKMEGKIKLNFGCVTYPDEAKTEEDLIKKARNV